jgi:hypothetical protein
MRGIWSTIVSTPFLLLLQSRMHRTQADDLALDRSAGHYEWHIAFPQPDVNLGAVRARFGEDGMLVIDVPRRP